MKKNLLKTMIALAAFCLGSMNVAAQNETATVPVKMTYVNYDAPDESYGELETILAGYNKVPSVGSAVGFGNTGWGCNWIGYLQVDVTAVPGVIQKAVLKAKVSGCTAPDASKTRTSNWGVALTDGVWSADMTYNATKEYVATKILNNGALVAGTGGRKNNFSDAEFDITEAIAGDAPRIATLVVYETAAEGAYFTEAEVEVEYEPFEATTMTYSFEDGVIPFLNGTNSGNGRITAAIEYNDVLASNVLGWTCGDKAQNGYSFSYYNFTSLLNNPALVKVEFDYFNTKGGRAQMTISDALVRGTDGSCEKVKYNKKGGIFMIGSDKNNFYINDNVLPQEDKVTTTTTTVTDEVTGEVTEVVEETTERGLCNLWMHVVVTINNDAKIVTWVVTDKNDELLHSGSSAFYSDDALSATQIDLFGYINNSHCAMIDNLEITNYKSNAKFADYTIQYVDANNTQIKDSRTGNGQVGKFVKLLDSDKSPVYAADNSKKYIYDSDDSETVAIAENGSSVISVKFRDAEVYGAVLNCMINGQSGAAARLASFQGDFFEGDNYYVYPSRGYSKDGKYYFTPATSWNGTTFAFPGSLNYRTISGKKTFIGELSYAPTAANEDGFGYVAGEDSVAYYSDIERLALPVVDEGEGTGLGQLVGTVNNWWSFSNGIFDRFSQGRGIRLDEGSYVWTEPIKDAAAYKVTIYGRNDKSAGNKNPYVLGIIKDGSDEVLLYTDLEIKEWGSATTGTNIVENVNIPAGAKLVIMNTNPDGLVSLDDISMTKTGDYIEPVTVGINSVVENAQPVSGIIYNLNGQAVKVATKGLYIKNGKVIVIK